MDPNVQKGFLMGYGYWNSLLEGDDYFRNQVEEYYRNAQNFQLEIPKVYNPSIAPEFANFNEMVRANSMAAYRQVNIPMNVAMMYAATSSQLPLGVPQLQYTLPPSAQVFTPVRAGISPQFTPFAYSAQFTDIQDVAYNYHRARLGASLSFGTEFAKLGTSSIIGGIVGGPWGIVAGALSYLALGILGNVISAPFSLHMREAERMQKATSYVVTGSTSPLGFGLNIRAASELGFRGQYMAETVGGMGYRDVEEIIRLGGATGLFTWAQDVETITKNLRQTIKIIGRIAQMTNDPDIRRHIMDIAQLQQLGVLPTEALNVYSAAQMASRVTGVGIRTLMETSGAYGAQTFNALNLLPGVGIMYGMNAATSARLAMATGNVSPLMAAFLGGPEGIVQRNINMQAAFLSAFSELAMPNMLSMSGGNLVFNRNAMMNYLSGGTGFLNMISGQASSLANLAASSGLPYTQVVTDYLFQKNLLKSEYMKAAGENPLVTDLNMLLGVAQLRRMNPNISLEMAALIMSGGDINNPEAVKNALAWASKYKNTRYIDEQLRQMQIQHRREAMAHITNLEETRGFWRTAFSPTSTFTHSISEWWRRKFSRTFQEIAEDILASREEWAGILSGAGLEGITMVEPKTTIGSIYEWLISPATNLFGNELAVGVVGSRKGFGEVMKGFYRLLATQRWEEEEARGILKTSTPYFNLWNTGGVVATKNAQEELKYWKIAEEFIESAISGAPFEKRMEELRRKYGEIDIGKLKYVVQNIPRSTELGGKVEQFFIMGKNMAAFETSQLRRALKDIGAEFMGQRWSSYGGVGDIVSIILKNIMINPDVFINKSQEEIENFILGEIKNLKGEYANVLMNTIGVHNIGTFVSDLAKNIRESSLSDVLMGGAFTAKVKALYPETTFKKFREKTPDDILKLFESVYGVRAVELENLVTQMRKEGKSEQYIKEQLLRGLNIFEKDRLVSSIPTAATEGSEKALTPEDWSKLAETMRALVKEMEKVSDKLRAQGGK